MVNINDFPSLFKDYYKNYEKFTNLYGENIIILHQTGHFYEIYDYPKNDMEFYCSDIYKVSAIVNLSVTRRDKNKELSTKNWLMSGVPLMKLEKYCDIFLKNNFHVIVISQTSAPPNPEREVTHILSPGTVLNNYNNDIENNLILIYIEKHIFNNKELLSAGISIINVSTGKNKLTDIIYGFIQPTDNNGTFESYASKPAFATIKALAVKNGVKFHFSAGGANSTIKTRLATIATNETSRNTFAKNVALLF